MSRLEEAFIKEVALAKEPKEPTVQDKLDIVVDAIKNLKIEIPQPVNVEQGAPANESKD